MPQACYSALAIRLPFRLPLCLSDQTGKNSNHPSTGAAWGGTSNSPIVYGGAPHLQILQVGIHHSKESAGVCIQGHPPLTIEEHLHGIDGNYPFSVTTASGVINITPFWGWFFSVILHDFIRQNYHKNQSDRTPFFPHYGKLPDFSYKLPHFIFLDVLSIFIFPPKVPLQCI